MDKEIQLKTKRLIIEPMSEDEIVEQINKYRDNILELSIAYEEMLEGVKSHPENFLFYGPWKMCKIVDLEKIGEAGFKGRQEDGSVEIGYGVDEVYQNRGYATEGVRELIAWVLEQPGVIRVDAEADDGNMVSQRVLEKLGFVPTGEYGEEGPRYVLRR